MARCLQTLILARAGLLDPYFCSIEEYLGHNTLDYYAVLAEVGRGKWSPYENPYPWIQFVFTAHYRQAHTFRRRAQEISRLWDNLEEEIEKKGIPDRAILALSDAAHGYTIRNVDYREGADVSQLVASRDLRVLVEAGFLLPSGEKRGRSYKATDVLLSIRERHRKKRPIPDPYERE